ncbi:MAG: PD-(D/E)XK nuclease family protein, partial [Pseudomonadota bacterium]
PVSARPKSVSVSDIHTWLRDPYAIYAKKVLGLKVLRPYDTPVGYDLQGSLLHSWLEDTVRLQMDGDDRPIEELMQLLIDDQLDRHDLDEEWLLLHGRAISKTLHNFPMFHSAALQAGGPVALEATGQLILKARDQVLTISGRADRIDQGADGVHIMDYKSGGTASMNEAQNYSPQLFLLALMMRDGKMEGLSTAPLHQISYVVLKEYTELFDTKKDEASKYLRGAALVDRLAAFQERFSTWVTSQFDPQTPYVAHLAPFKRDDQGDFDDLARRLEWMNETSSDE